MRTAAMSRRRGQERPRRRFRDRDRQRGVPAARADVAGILDDGEAHFHAGRFADAEACFRQVVAIAGERTPARGAAHAWLGRLAAVREDLCEALDCYRAACQHQPDEPEIRDERGFILNRLGRFDEAASELREAIRLDPGSPSAHFNLGISLLAQGDFARGWAEYEWRLRMDFPWIHYRSTDCPRWEGEPLAGRTILLHAEQGLGDTIQLIRFAPLVKAQAGRAILAFPPEMAPLAGLLHWAVRCASATAGDPPEPPRDGSARWDVHASLFSLPFLLGTTPTTIPPAPYILPEPEHVERWRPAMEPIEGFRVGIAWRGGTVHPEDRFRSFRLAEFAPLASIPGVRLISLQKGEAVQELAGAPFPVVDLGARYRAGDWLDTLGIVSQLDLVIACDTAIVHLAGAVGMPVWIALGFAADWRWMVNRDDSPWYPTLRLFRQNQPDEWAPVFERMAEALRCSIRP
jgi:hypothetical protein